MPTKAQIKVSAVEHSTTTSKDGDPLNWCWVKGVTAAGQNFKKRFFATKKDQTATKNAEVADSLANGDWVEIVMDDTEYTNVQTVRKIAKPDGSTTDSSNTPAKSGGSFGVVDKGDKMTKAEWAAKDAAKELSMARHKAIEASAIMCTGKGITKASVESVEKLVDRFTSYILNGNFDGEAPCCPDEPVVDKTVGPGPVDDDGPSNSTPDDDIPF